MKRKEVVFWVIVALWFLICHFFIFPKEDLLYVIVAVPMYLFGSLYVSCWLFRKTMYPPYSPTLLANDEEAKFNRHFMFGIGLLLMMMFSVGV